MSDQLDPPLERAQVGIRLDKRLTKVLKGMAEYLDVSLNDLVESALLHAVHTEGYQVLAPWRTRKARMVAVDLKKVYGLHEVDPGRLLFIDPARQALPANQLFTALHAGQPAEALALLQTYPELRNQRDREGFPPIISAARINSIPMLELLIADGVDIEIEDPEYRDTPLGWAAYYGNIEAVSYLLGRGAVLERSDAEGYSIVANAERGRDGQLNRFGVRASPGQFERVLELLRHHLSGGTPRT